MDDPSIRIIFVFLDGVGLGKDDEENNPLSALVLPSFDRLANGGRWIQHQDATSDKNHVFRPIDANLDLEGLPQSGTGQASLLTGENCAFIAGRHYGPFPHSLTREVLRSRNVFTQIKELLPEGRDPVAFANAYPPRFFTYMAEKNRWTVTTRICRDSGVLIRDTQHLHNGQALAADITGRAWKDALLSDYTPISERMAAERLYQLSRPHSFTLFEYFLTDKAGHAQSRTMAAEVLHSLDRFFERLIELIVPQTDLLLVTSDHGNLEDLSTKSHTRNPVPLIASGRGASHFQDVTSITGVTPAILSALKDQS